MDQNIYLELSKFGILIGAIWALIQFWSANEFKKTQYLSELWRKFYSTEKFVIIFDALDRDDLNEFEKIDSKDLFAYLAFLEEIVIFRRTKFWQIYKIRDKNLIDLFQYHFHNIYNNNQSETRIEFWKKIIKKNDNSNEQIDVNAELQKGYWKLQKKFAQKCSEIINTY